ncbi:hypothetical protein BKI52_07010 [marine bacterium AO1-C]|nr:hypothetical protein BKI52_07010 [marine bacterium AO1-C]
MYKNYFKVAWRNLFRQKLYALLNIGGLAIGLSGFIMIVLYIQHELSYDRFYSNSDQIYRIYQRLEGNNIQGSDFFAYTSAPVATALKREYPEVTQATCTQPQKSLLSHQKQHFWEEGLWADAQFFKVFPIDFIQGNPATALAQPKSIVLTQTLALKLFGQTKNVVGQTITYRDKHRYNITGIVSDPPSNSTLQYRFIVSIYSHRGYRRALKKETWGNNDFHTFVTLKKGSDPQTLAQKFPSLLDKYQPRDASFPFKESFHIQPLTDMHLETGINSDLGKKGSPRYIYLFSAIAGLVLLLACINYMNLAIARSVRRVHEIGLRKTFGAIRRQLIGQFLSEAILIAFLALLIALGLTDLLLPRFSHLMDSPLSFNLQNTPWFIPALAALVFIVGGLSGSYPAFFLSSLDPVKALKGQLGKKFSGIKLQSWLIVLQNATSIILIISSLVVYFQFRFIQNKELGYNKDQVVSISVLDRNLHKRISAIKNEWSGNSAILHTTTSAGLPVDIRHSTIVHHLNKSLKKDGIATYRTHVDPDYLKVFGLKLIAGRNFSSQMATDATQARIINESMAKALGWTPQEAIGKTIVDYKKKTIIGVVKDFHMHSLRKKIAPLMLILRDDYLEYISVKVRPENMGTTIAYLESSLKKYTSYPFEYSFIDQKYDQLYKSDERLSQMFGFFTLLSIFIASLGLFGLAAFSIERRTKEIGIRKVLGASARHIVTVMSQEFLKMILIGFMVAIPIAWYAMDHWLREFAYRIEIKWWMFVLAGVMAFLVAIVTISYQSLRAIFTNPVKALRNE